MARKRRGMLDDWYIGYIRYDDGEIEYVSNFDIYKRNPDRQYASKYISKGAAMASARRLMNYLISGGLVVSGSGTYRVNGKTNRIDDI